MNRRQFLIVRTPAGFAAGAAALALPWWALKARAAEGGISPTKITIGSSMPLTGPLGNSGNALMQGVLAAFTAANKAGGVFGRTLEFEVQDDSYVPDRTRTNVQALIGGNAVLALLTLVGTANLAAALPGIERAAIPCIGPVTGADSLRQASHRQIFHVRASYRDEMQRLIRQLVEMGLPSISIVHLDNPFGKEVLALAQTAMTANKMNSAGAFSLAVDGSNAASVVQQVWDAGAGAVLMATAGAASTSFLTQLRQRARGLPVVGLSVTLPGSDLAKLGDAVAGVAVTQVFPNPRSTKLSVMRDFQAALAAANAQQFVVGAFEGWVNAQVLLEGLRRCGRDVSRERLRGALLSMRRLDLGELSLGFAALGPFVASRFVDFAILGPGGTRVG